MIPKYLRAEIVIEDRFSTGVRKRQCYCNWI